MLEYGRREAALAADLRAVIGPLLEEPGELAADGTAGGTSTGQQRELERLLGILVNEPPFAPQELLIYCLRLSGAGFSVRRIAALVGSSKSSVGRYLIAGLAGVDLEELQSERRKRLQAPPPDVTGYDGKALREVGVATISYVRRLGLDRIKASDLEERVVIVADAEEALDPDIMRRPPRTPDRIEAPVAPLPKPVPDDLPRRAKSVSLSRGPARWKTG
jgi:hypothetical protein